LGWGGCGFFRVGGLNGGGEAGGGGGGGGANDNEEFLGGTRSHSFASATSLIVRG